MNNNTIEYQVEHIYSEIRFGQENILYFNGPVLILESTYKNWKDYGMASGLLCQVNIFGVTLQGFVKSIDDKILTFRMVDAKLKDFKRGYYTYARDKETESKIEKELKDNGY